VVVTNLKDDGMTLDDRVSDLVGTLGFQIPTDVAISQVKRLQGRNGKPGLVKVAFDSLESKIKVLKAKRSLKAKPQYSNCWMRSSKSHAERVTELNFQALLDLIPEGDQYKLTSNGKLVHQDDLDPGGADGGGVGGATYHSGGSFRGRGNQGRGRGGPRRGMRRNNWRGDYSINDLNPRNPNRPDMY
jgi:hypothetical protein